MQKLEIVREKIESKYRVVKSDVDLEWNRAIDLCMNIINAHISRENGPEITRSSRDNKCGECSRRKWYMKGYVEALKEDGVSEAFLEDCKRVAQKYKKDNGGWIPVEEYGLPKEEGVYDLTIIDGRGVYDSVRWQFLEGTHLSGHQHCVDGIHYWADNYRGDPINKFLSNRVIAWKKKPDPYRPERSRENEK